MKRWHLPSVPGSSSKANPREAGPDAPRVPSSGQQSPRVLFSAPECRIVVLDVGRGERLAEHQVRERALVQVVSGRVAMESAGETIECEAGTLVTFEPGEHHSLQGLEDARLLLILTPWPAAGHTLASEEHDPEQIPANARVDPLPTSSSDPRS